MAGARTDHWYDTTGLTLETGANAATYLRDQGGTLLSTNTGGATYTYGRDRLGSVTALVNGSGALANSYTYAPWGDTLASTGTVSNPFQFTSTYHDSSAYYLMGARYYHQPTGRFTQLDPLPSSIVSVNRYAYTDCNPANATDPSGLNTCSFDEMFGAVTSAVFAGWTFRDAVLVAAAATSGWVVVGAGVVMLVSVLAIQYYSQKTIACAQGTW